MKLFSSLLIFALLQIGVPLAFARGRAEHVVVVVWDGMRPDFITPQYTPTLYELARRGTFFKNHHSAYITSTEVNGTALATGMHPDRSGIMANTAYRPELDWLSSYGTESLDAVRRGDMWTGGRYLEAATVAEILQKAGFPTIIAGAKPIALLHDRATQKTTQAEKDSVTLFRGLALPRSVQDSLTKAIDIGPFPSAQLAGARGRGGGRGTTTNNNETVTPAFTAPAFGSEESGFRRGGGGGGSAALTPDSWTVRALTRGLWRKSVPKYTLLWLSEPDAAQHRTGVGSDASIEALESSDKNLAAVLKSLEDKGVLESTDIFVVSDHGFSTIGRTVDIIELLKKAKFNASARFENPDTGDIMVINLGGSTSFYVFNNDEAVIRKLVTYLQGSDFAGVIFSALRVEGTFLLSDVHISVTNSAPDVVVSMRWSSDKNENGAPGLITSPGQKGLGTHASLSRFDLHNTLVAAGPDFKEGFVSELPSGNIDVAPTVLSILGASPPCPTDGRVLIEAMTTGEGTVPKSEPQTIEASRDLGFLVWKQYLKLTRLGPATYYDEGNGECRIK